MSEWVADKEWLAETGRLSFKYRVGEWEGGSIFQATSGKWAAHYHNGSLDTTCGDKAKRLLERFAASEYPSQAYQLVYDPEATRLYVGDYMAGVFYAQRYDKDSTTVIALGGETVLLNPRIMLMIDCYCPVFDTEQEAKASIERIAKIMEAKDE